MIFPYKNYPKDWNLTAGLGFGSKTSYGFHEAQDVNNWGGGNSDYGLPIYAIADGEVTSVHNHTTKPTFGNHIHYLIVGVWGQRWVHHAHLSEILVKVGDKVREGQLIARIGNSGTTYAHDHWAIKKQPTGIDGIANTFERLQLWEDPTNFVVKYMNQTPQPMPTDPDSQPMPVVRGDLYQAIVRENMSDGEKSFRETQNPRLNTIQLAEDLLRNDGRAKAYWANVWGLSTKPDITSFSDDALVAELLRRLKLG